MKTTFLRAALVVALVGLGGCSGSDESEVAELPPVETSSANSPSSAATATPESTASADTGTDGALDKIETFRNPFAPPKDPPPPPIAVEPDPEPEPQPEPGPEIRQPGTPPKFRLVGFLNAGEPKVYVAYRDKLEMLAIGDTLEEMKVVKIDSPDLTMQFEDREIQLSLFDQAWQHAGGPTSGGNSNRTQTRPRSTPPPRNTSASSSRPSSSRPAAASGGAATSDIPGFGPSAFKPPGFQPPTSSEPLPAAGGSLGSPPTGLPGLRSEATGGGINGGELPSIPGLNDGDGDNPGPGALPAFPGGR